MSEKFCLRWNDFESNINIAFQEIRNEKDFFDCTLSCGPRQIQAHKLILSACSPFFKNILKQNPHQNPLIYLKGVPFNELQYVLDFMYHGEVSVSQNDLNSFLSIAEELQIKGLSQNESSKKNASGIDNKRINKPFTENQNQKSELSKSSTSYKQKSFSTNDEVVEVTPFVKSEPDSYSSSQQQETNSLSLGFQTSDEIEIESGNQNQELIPNIDESYGYAEDGYAYGDFGAEANYSDHLDSEAQRGIDDCVIRFGNAHRCTLCGRDFTEPQNCKRHVREKHFGLDQENCPYCDVSFSKRNLKTHISKCKAVASF